MTKRRSYYSKQGTDWTKVIIVSAFMVFMVIGTLAFMGFIQFNGGNNAANTDIPDQQVRLRFSIVEASNGSAITSGTVMLWVVENGLYVSPEPLTIADDGTVTTNLFYTYGQVVAIQYRDAAVGTSMNHYTTPIETFTVTFSDNVDQGSIVYVDAVAVKAITTAVTASFADINGNSIGSGNYSTTDQGIRVTLSGLTSDSYFGGEDFVDYIDTNNPEYEGGIFIVIKSDVSQDFADSPNLYAQGSTTTYYYYVFKFDPLHRVGSTPLSQNYDFPTVTGFTLNAGTLYISVYDYYHAGSDFSLSRLSATRAITSYSGYIV